MRKAGQNFLAGLLVNGMYAVYGKHRFQFSGEKEWATL